MILKAETKKKQSLNHTWARKKLQMKKAGTNSKSNTEIFEIVQNRNIAVKSFKLKQLFDQS